MLHLIYFRASSILVECKSNFHGGSNTIVKFWPLENVLALLILELNLHVRLGYRDEPSLVDFWDSQGLSWQSLQGSELQSTSAHRFGKLSQEVFVQKLLLLNCHLLLCQGFTICDVVEFNDDFGGRVQEVSNLFVSGVIGEPVFDEITDLVVPLLLSLTATPIQASMSIYEVSSGLHYVRLHLSSVVLLL